MRKNFEILQANLPMIFINKNDGGAPQLFKHQCLPSRVGLPITDHELMDFGLDLLEELYSKKGVAITRKKNGLQNCLVLENKQEGIIFYVVVKVDRYPVNPLNIDESGCEGIIELARKNSAEVLFAPLSFSCFTNTTSVNDLADTNKAVAGGYYVCAYRGLMKFGNY
jgi:hypothetical protein